MTSKLMEFGLSSGEASLKLPNEGIIPAVGRTYRREIEEIHNVGSGRGKFCSIYGIDWLALEWLR